MTTTIITKNSSTASAVPLAADLTAGELAINLSDKRLFAKNGSTVFEVGTNPSAIALSNGTGLPIVAGTTGTLSTARGGTNLTSFTANGVVYASSTSALATGSALTFDGSLLKTSGAISVQGVAFPASGAGAELFWDGSESVLQSYNRTSSAYAPLWLEGSYTRFGINGSEQIRLTSTGLGIGTSSPATKLQVYAGALVVGNESTYAARFGNNSNKGVTIGYDTTNNVGHIGSINPAVAWTDLVINANGGNLGLGVTPSAWSGAGSLQLPFGNITGNTGINLSANSYYNGGYKYVGTGASTTYVQSGGQHIFYTAPSGTAGNAITFTQAMTLGSDGNLLLGTTSNGLIAARTCIQSTMGEYGTAYQSPSNGGVYYHIVFGQNTTAAGSITSTGGVTLYSTTSDQRLKENIQDSENASLLIDALQVRQFDWKAEGNHQRYGFVAQELVTVAPEAVHQPADPEEMMAVDYSKLVPMLVKEIQSLRKRLADAGIA